MKSIFTRTYIIMVLLMLVGFISSIFVADNIFERTDGELFRRDAAIEARLIEAELAQLPSDEWADFVRAWSPIFETSVALYPRAELQVGPYAAHFDPENDAAFTGSFEAWWLIHPLPGKTLYLLVEENERPLAAAPLQDWFVLFAPLLTIALLVGAALWFISRYIAKPIDELSSVAGSLAAGQLETRANTRIAEPIRSLALRFNSMANDIQSLVRDQQVIIGALPHELRTPLGRARFALDMTRSIESVDDLHRQLEKVDGYVVELESVVQDALSLSRVQLTDTPIDAQFALDDVIAELCELRRDGSSKTLEWTCAITPPVCGDEGLIRLAIANLVDNALRYGNSRVRVLAHRKSSDAISIAVDDDGPGIPAAQRDAIFAPFYRLDTSRSRTTGGVGLGLALVDLIARRANGTISVSSSEWGGARFQFCWPQPQDAWRVTSR